VILPDLAAGCSMADMAAIDQVEDCWDDLVEAGVAEATVPVTYMNSSAAIKAFTGRHGGTICTSSNAKTALTWALEKAGDGGKVLFLPDQHLGRNTYARDLGGSLEDCVVWDPHRPMGGLTPEQLRDATMILWRGHCSVHGRFTVEAVEAARRDDPRRQGDRAPGVPHEVVELADEVGSTEKIIKTIAAAPAGTAWVVGTELNLVRLAAAVPRAADRLPGEERLLLLDDEPDRPAAPGVGAGVARRGSVVNPIRVDPDVAHHARVALDQMLALPGRDLEGLTRDARRGRRGPGTAARSRPRDGAPTASGVRTTLCLSIPASTVRHPRRPARASSAISSKAVTGPSQRTSAPSRPPASMGWSTPPGLSTAPPKRCCAAWRVRPRTAPIAAQLWPPARGRRDRLVGAGRGSPREPRRPEPRARGGRRSPGRCRRG
jgi:quinolinate synthetase A subunit